MSITCRSSDWYDEIKKCPSCGGEVHSHFGDENYDGDYWLYFHCHECGESYDEDEFNEMKELEQQCLLILFFKLLLNVTINIQPTIYIIVGDT